MTLPEKLIWNWTLRNSDSRGVGGADEKIPEKFPRSHPGHIDVCWEWIFPAGPNSDFVRAGRILRAIRARMIVHSRAGRQRNIAYAELALALPCAIPSDDRVIQGTSLDYCAHEPMKVGIPARMGILAVKMPPRAIPAQRNGIPMRRLNSLLTALILLAGTDCSRSQPLPVNMPVPTNQISRVKMSVLALDADPQTMSCIAFYGGASQQYSNYLTLTNLGGTFSGAFVGKSREAFAVGTTQYLAAIAVGTNWFCTGDMTPEATWVAQQPAQTNMITVSAGQWGLILTNPAGQNFWRLFGGTNVCESSDLKVWFGIANVTNGSRLTIRKAIQ